MYTKESEEHQFSFTHDWFVVPEVDENHELIKIAKAIDWVSVSEKLSHFYCADNGRLAKPSRAKIGLLILKHLYRYSDAELADLIKRDIYAQYLCDVSLKEAKNFINPSTLSKFRKQIGIEGIKLIEWEVFKSLQRTKLLKGRRLVCDTTVVPSDIAYPTDVSLLNKVREKAVQHLDTARQFGAKIFRAYKRAARRVFITYQKIRHHTRQSRRKVQRKLLQFSRRNITQLKEAISAIATAADTTASKAAEAFIKETQLFIDTASTILTQQKDVYQGLPVKERIVSVHKPYIWPMVRGKYPIEVEFGPKVLLNLKNKCLFLESLNFANVSDTNLLETAIDAYKDRFGAYPNQLSAERGFWSKENYLLAEESDISKIAIENKGKSSYLEHKSFRERLRRLRCSIEAKISFG